MEFKTGKGNASNSSTWVVCYDEINNRYTAKTSLANDTGHWIHLYEITKEVYDMVGTFEDDDYKSQELIRTQGRLLYEDMFDKYSGWPVSHVKDVNYRQICNWAFEDDVE